MGKVGNNRLPFFFSGERLSELRALHGNSCNVLFLSNEAMSVLATLSETVLWATRWNEGERGGELPEIATEIYTELTMNTCTVEALGTAIGEALSMAITVNNQQIVSGCCELPPGTLLPDGTVSQPPLFLPPAEWGEPFAGEASDDELCALAYACWEYGGVIFEMLVQLRGIVAVLGVVALLGAVAALVVATIPTAWALILGGTSAVSLVAVLGELTAQSKLLEYSVTAGQNWQSDKDNIICNFRASLEAGGVSAENQFLAAMLAVYGELLDEAGIIEVDDLIGATGMADWLSENIFDGGDFSPIDMPVDYVCCSLPSSIYTWLVGTASGRECPTVAHVFDTCNPEHFDSYGGRESRYRISGEGSFMGTGVWVDAVIPSDSSIRLYASNYNALFAETNDPLVVKTTTGLSYHPFTAPAEFGHNTSSIPASFDLQAFHDGNPAHPLMVSWGVY